MKSPFVVVPNFLSPLTCERIAEEIKVVNPTVDLTGRPLKQERHCLNWEMPIAERFREIVPTIEETYDCSYRGLEQPVFQFYPEYSKAPAENPGCENSRFVRKKWVMYKDVDLVGFIWLKDYNDNVPLDPRHEVYGGKLEFTHPAHQFSLLPQRGTLVLYPAGPHFITVISPVLLGDLYQIKLNVCVEEKSGGRWLYQPAKFPGTWQEWLAGHF